MRLLNPSLSLIQVLIQESEEFPLAEGIPSARSFVEQLISDLLHKRVINFLGGRCTSELSSLYKRILEAVPINNLYGTWKEENF
ncbi:hypothetical protein L1049_014853 [Liquidambar formosana]|uniref:Uncharacterized protein n=1 Tax=Liquidambar formosana TaxID=63359 RepID=A0AAP0S2Q9_LIQFO